MNNNTNEGTNKVMLNPRMNELLNQLPESEFSQLLPFFQLVSLTAGDTLYETGQKINSIYFPINALISISTVFPDGNSIDTATTGQEGLIGIKALTLELSIHRIYVSSSGFAYRLNTADLNDDLFNSLAFYKIMLIASTQLHQKMSNEMICCKFHSIESRLARWLIVRYDLEKSTTIKTTHQFIARSMGVRRESITNASAKLKGVKNFRGLIEIRDRSILETQCCECYYLHRQAFSKQSSLPFYI